MKQEQATSVQNIVDRNRVKGHGGPALTSLIHEMDPAHETVRVYMDRFYLRFESPLLRKVSQQELFIPRSSIGDDFALIDLHDLIAAAFEKQEVLAREEQEGLFWRLDNSYYDTISVKKPMKEDFSTASALKESMVGTLTQIEEAVKAAEAKDKDDYDYAVRCHYSALRDRNIEFREDLFKEEGVVNDEAANQFFNFVNEEWSSLTRKDRAYRFMEIVDAVTKLQRTK